MLRKKKKEQEQEQEKEKEKQKSRKLKAPSFPPPPHRKAKLSQRLERIRSTVQNHHHALLGRAGSVTRFGTLDERS